MGVKRLLEESDVTDLERALLQSITADEAPADGADRLFEQLVNRSEATAPVVPMQPRKKIPSWVWLAAAVFLGVGVVVLDRSRQEKVVIVHDAPTITVPTSAPAPVASIEPAAETQLPPPAKSAESAPSAAPSHMVIIKPATSSSGPTTVAKGKTLQEALQKAWAERDAGTSDLPFDKGEAAKGLGRVDLQDCKQEPGPTGAGHVTVTFQPDGSVATAVVDGGPYPGTPRGACIAGKFRSVHVSPFGGASVRVGKSFVIN